MLPLNLSKRVEAFAFGLKRIQPHIDVSHNYAAHHDAYFDGSKPIRLTPRRLFETFNKLAEVIPGEEGGEVRDGLKGATAVTLKRGAMSSLVLYSLAHPLLSKEQITALFEGVTNNDIRAIRRVITKNELDILVTKVFRASDSFNAFKNQHYPNHPSTAHVTNVFTVVCGILKNLSLRY